MRGETCRQANGAKEGAGKAKVVSLQDVPRPLTASGRPRRALASGLQNGGSNRVGGVRRPNLQSRSNPSRTVIESRAP